VVTFDGAVTGWGERIRTRVKVLIILFLMGSDLNVKKNETAIVRDERATVTDRLNI
jgi:hypothetical protein